MPLIEQVTKCVHSIKEMVWTRSGRITPVVGKLQAKTKMPFIYFRNHKV